MSNMTFKLTFDWGQAKGQIGEAKKAIKDLTDSTQRPAQLYTLDDMTGKVKLVRDSATMAQEELGKLGQLYYIDDATGKMKEFEQQAISIAEEVQKPKSLRIDANQALATMRDVKIAVDGVVQVFQGLVRSINGLLDAALQQRQAAILSEIAFAGASAEMQNFASAMQNLTNFGDEETLVLMSKLAQTFKLNKDEIQQLMPLLLDFTEANKATGMSLESATDLMGRALSGHTEMLGRYGIELDKSRLQMEGVSYLVEKLGGDYGGTAQALADLRLQNINAWGDIKETVGEMLTVIINPLLQGLKWLMDAYNDLDPVVKGFVTGLVIAIPVIGTMATSITALTAAYNALKVAINPIAGLISIAVGAIAAFSFGIAAAKMQTDLAAKSQVNLSDEISSGQRDIMVQAESFSLLTTRLLELRKSTNLTAEEKAELNNVIQQLNSKYGEYIGNINLETASYNTLRLALDRANKALIDKMTTMAYENILSKQVQRLAEAKVDLSRTMNDLLNVSVPSTQNNFMSVAYEQLKMLENRFSDWKTNPTYRAIRVLYDQVSMETQTLKSATNEYNIAVSNIKNVGQGKKPEVGDDVNTQAVDGEKKAYEQLLKELADLRKSELELIQQDYDAKLALIQKYALAGSDIEKGAIADLDAWKLDSETRLFDRQKRAEEVALESIKNSSKAKFVAQIDYYSNLQQMGIGSYDALKATMEEYYAWSKDNLTKLEQEMLLIQLRQANLRWGEYRQREAEEEYRRLYELAETRDEFEEREFDLQGNSYEVQLRAIEKYYASRKDKMIAAGISEEEIEKQRLASIQQLNLQSSQQMLSGVSSVLNNLASTADKNSESGFKVWKGLALAQAMVDIPSSAIAAYKSMVGIPIAGPTLAVAAAAAAVAAGVANVEQIRKTKYQKAATGGLLVGNSHADGGVVIEAEGDEYITAKDRVKALGRRLFDYINFAPLQDVKNALANMVYPNMPIPAVAGLSYASGGSVANGSMSKLLGVMETLISEVADLKQVVRDNHPKIMVQVDPLSNNPVKVSEIAERGSIMRSQI